MSRTKPCPSCDRPIVETARTCCFCGRDTEARRPTLTAICYPLSDREAKDIPVGRVGEPQSAAVIRPFPVVASGDAPRPEPEEEGGGASGEPPDRRRALFRQTPPIRAIVFLLSVAVLLTASGSLYPQHAAEFDTLRGFVAVGGLYWILLSPFTTRTPTLVGAMYLPMIIRRRPFSGLHPQWEPLDWLLAFLMIQALLISCFRLARWKGRYLMSVSQLDEPEEGSPVDRCRPFNV
jgi:hypothetical protein